jgi:hypothetical protein
MHPILNIYYSPLCDISPRPPRYAVCATTLYLWPNRLLGLRPAVAKVGSECGYATPEVLRCLYRMPSVRSTLPSIVIHLLSWASTTFRSLTERVVVEDVACVAYTKS